MATSAGSTGTAASFVDQAQRGRCEWWRFLLSLLVICGGFLLGMIFQFVTALRGQDAIVAGSSGPANPHPVLLVASNLPFALGAVGLFVAVRLIHRRPLLSLATPKARLNWPKIGLGFGLWLVLFVAEALALQIIHPTPLRLVGDLGRWLVVLPLAVVLISIQTTAEELFFRGYLLQSAALLSRNWIWLVAVTGVPFLFAHFSGAWVTSGGGSIILTYVVMSVFFAVITLVSNSAEVAIGVHAANNMWVFLLLGAPDDGTVPLLQPTSAGAPSLLGPAILAAQFLVVTAIVVWLRRRSSPRRVSRVVTSS